MKRQHQFCIDSIQYLDPQGALDPAFDSTRIDPARLPDDGARAPV
jgi:hypothetical protein